MDSNLFQKVNRLNELYAKLEAMKALTEPEYKEQGMLREELINYFKYAMDKRNTDMV